MFRFTRGLLWVAAFSLIAPVVTPRNAFAQSDEPKKKDKDKDADTDKPQKKGKKPAKKVLGFRVGPREKTTFTVDAGSSRNEISFTSKAPKETITGKASEVTGDLEFDPHNIAHASGKFTVPWKSVDTGNKMRNEHLFGAPWVDSAAHPDIVLTVTGFEDIMSSSKKGTSAKAKLIGTMAMNGEEKKMTIPVTLIYLGTDKSKSDEDVKEGVGIKAKFKIALKDFNIEGKPGAVGNAVSPEQDVSVSLFLAKGEKSETEKESDKPAKSESGPRPLGHGRKKR